MMKAIRIIYAVLMLACLVYSGSIYLIGSGTFSFVIWLGLAMLFGIAFFLAGNSRWLMVPAVLRKTCYILIALALLTMIICMGAMASHFSDKGEKDLDYIVVLGAQMKNNGPSTIFQYRLDAAYEYLSENPGTVCIVSGGKGANESVSEGEGGKEYLMSKGIAPERIIAEPKAVNTMQNITFSLDIMQQLSGTDKALRIGIVTNNYHVFRGIYLAKSLTDNKICGIAAYTIPWYLPNNMVRECFGIIRDFSKLQ
ncbi:MAG: YdcF family protein [Butyrivibrio sp.]|nr:YdcF family protein [Butyrivibrio sp.]